MKIGLLVAMLGSPARAASRLVQSRSDLSRFAGFLFSWGPWPPNPRVAFLGRFFGGTPPKKRAIKNAPQFELVGLGAICEVEDGAMFTLKPKPF